MITLLDFFINWGSGFQALNGSAEKDARSTQNCRSDCQGPGIFCLYTLKSTIKGCKKRPMLLIEHTLSSSPMPAKKMEARKPMAMLLVVFSMALKFCLPIRDSLISMEAKKAPTIKCSPKVSVKVEKSKTKAKNRANSDSLPFNNPTNLSRDSCR